MGMASVSVVSEQAVYADGLSTAIFIGGPSLSYDGNVLYFFASDKEANTEDIFYSLREGEYWGSPIEIGTPINTSRYEGFPSSNNTT